MNEVTTIVVEDEAATAPSFPMMRIPNTTPMHLLAGAIERGAGLDMVRELIGLQKEWDSYQARKAFDEAIAAAKAEISPVVRNKKGHNDKRYADFAAIARAVDPVISKHGLSYRFRTIQDERIKVTCILSHKLGHYEETTLAGPADTSGNKNAIQAIGSTLSYLQRYSLVQALGLAASDDDDGKSSTAAVADKNIDEKQVETLTKLLADKGRTVEQLCQVFNLEQLSDLPANRYSAAVDKIASAQATKKDS